MKRPEQEILLIVLFVVLFGVAAGAMALTWDLPPCWPECR